VIDYDWTWIALYFNINQMHERTNGQKQKVGMVQITRVIKSKNSSRKSHE